MNIFPAEYTSLSTTALLELVVNRYAVEKDASILFLKRGFNDTYLISTGKQKFILRVYKHGRRTLASIKSEISLLEHLKTGGLSVAYAIKDKSDEYIQTIHAPEGERYAVLFRYAEGERVKKLNTDQAFRLGAETGQLHSLTENTNFLPGAEDYDIEKQFANSLTTLKPVLVNYPDAYTYLEKLSADFKNKFSSINKEALAKGTCHGDLQAENFHLAENGELTFFDFDFFGPGYLAYDIGVFIWYDHKNKPKEIIDAFLKGYTTKRKLTETEKELLPWFSTLRAIFQMTLYCTISDGKQLPLWPPDQVADFLKKVEKWQGPN